MPASLKAVIFNNEEGFGGELRRLVQPLRHIKIVAEIGEVSLLEDCLKRFGCEVVLVNLDPQPEDYLKQISQIVSHLPGVKVFAFSAKEDAQLILSAMRAGIGEFITKPVDGPELVKSLGKIMELAPEKAAGRLIAVTGASGGCGATMIACNLAAELSGLHREEMGLIDLDFDFGAAAAFFDVSPQYSISELASSDTIEQSMLSDSLVRHPSQVAILARPTRMEDAHVLSADRSAAIISMMSEMFPIVVIDFPPHFDQLGCAVLDQLDLLILVVNLNVPSIKNAERIGDALNRRGFSSEKIKVVVNGDTGQKGQIQVSHVEQVLRHPIFSVVPHEAEVVSHAVNFGQPLIQDAPDSKARKRIFEMAKKIINEQGGTSSPVEEKSEGVLTKMFSL